MSLSAGLHPKHNIARFQCLSCRSEPISFVSKSRGSFVKSSLYTALAMSAMSGANTSTFLVLLMELSVFLWCSFAWWEVIPWASNWSPSGSSSGHPLLLSSASESSDSFSDLLVFSYRPLAIFIVMIIFKMMFTRRTRRHSFKLQLCQCDRSLPIPAPGWWWWCWCWGWWGCCWLL